MLYKQIKSQNIKLDVLETFVLSPFLSPSFFTPSFQYQLNLQDMKYIYVCARVWTAESRNWQKVIPQIIKISNLWMHRLIFFIFKLTNQANNRIRHVSLSFDV